MTERENNFTLTEWAAVKGEVYSSTPEADEEIVAAAKAFSDVCAKHGLPCVALWQGSQTEDGSFGLGVEAELNSLERAGPAILFATLLPFEQDPLATLYAVMSHFSKRKNL